MSGEATKSAKAFTPNGAFPTLSKEEDELVEKEIRDRFKKMCEGYFDSVSKKLVIEHNVSLAIWGKHDVNPARSVSKSKTGRIMRRISGRVRYLRIGSRRMRR